MAIAAARERKMGLSQFIEQAITCYLEADNEADSRADNGADTRADSRLLSRLAALESRVAALEWHSQVAWPESPTRDMNVH
jgi:cytidylate kinase